MCGARLRMRIPDEPYDHKVLSVARFGMYRYMPYRMTGFRESGENTKPVSPYFSRSASRGTGKMGYGHARVQKGNSVFARESSTVASQSPLVFARESATAANQGQRRDRGLDCFAKPRKDGRGREGIIRKRHSMEYILKK